MPEFYIIIARKKYFPDFFFLGGGTCAYGTTVNRLRLENTNGKGGGCSHLMCKLATWAGKSI